MNVEKLVADLNKLQGALNSIPSPFTVLKGQILHYSDSNLDIYCQSELSKLATTVIMSSATPLFIILGAHDYIKVCLNPSKMQLESQQSACTFLKSYVSPIFDDLSAQPDLKGGYPFEASEPNKAQGAVYDLVDNFDNLLAEVYQSTRNLYEEILTKECPLITEIDGVKQEL